MKRLSKRYRRFSDLFFLAELSLLWVAVPAATYLLLAGRFTFPGPAWALWVTWAFLLMSSVAAWKAYRRPGSG